MNKTYTILCLLLCSQISFGQITLEGVIRDTLKNPLELASLVAINKETNGFESYDITNDLGKYALTLKENTSYKLQISYIGLQTITENITTNALNIRKDFTLKAEFALDEVELVYKMPVAIKGDTLVYNADAYKNGTERKLEDIIEKLPGVEINERGQIEVEGKVVNKLMVNGKDFFDGDTKIATKNIPSKKLKI